jgi:hypothetical protein
MLDGGGPSLFRLLAIISVALVYAIGATGRGSEAAMAYQMAGEAADNGAFDAARSCIRLTCEADGSEAKQRRNSNKSSHVKAPLSPSNPFGAPLVQFPPSN